MKNTTVVEASKLELPLLALRMGIFLVMLMWTLDKFYNPDHAISIFENFYSVPGVAATLVYTLAVLEMILILLFVAGVARFWTYGLVMLLHAGSTLSSFGLYLSPFDNLLFFAAWPMLAACFALFMLREYDNMWVLRLPGQSAAAGA